MRKYLAVLVALALICCCGAKQSELRVLADLRQARLSIYRGEVLLSEQPLHTHCAALPLGDWLITDRTESAYRLSCPWGEYYLESAWQLPIGTRVQVLGEPVTVSCQTVPGERGAAIWRMQQGLMELGYLDTEPTGIADARTLAALHALRYCADK